MKARTKDDRKRELQRMTREQIITAWRAAMNAADDETIKHAHLMISDILAREFPDENEGQQR